MAVPSSSRIHADASMRRSDKSSNGRKSLLPPSKTHFAWAMEQRAQTKTYFHTRAENWVPLNTKQLRAEAEAAAAAALAAQKPATSGNSPVRASMLAPTPTRQMVRPPSHLVFRTGAVTRTPKPE